MSSQDQVYGAVGRLPPSMQSLRERIGGLKAATTSAAIPTTAKSDVDQQYTRALEGAQDGGPGQEQFGRDNGNVSFQRKKTGWETELDEYLRALSDASTVADLRGKLQCPKAWLRFLQTEELTRRSQRGAGAPLQVGMGRLYEWATKAIPRSQNISNEDYLWIWIGYAKQQMESSEEDARQVFKYLKSHHVGHNLASLYEEWALFEIAAGQPQKALQKVHEGIRQQATPVARLEALQEKLLAALPATRKGVSAVQASPRVQQASKSQFQGALEHPSPVPCSSTVGKPFLSLPGQATPSADHVRQDQSTPSTHRQQPFQPLLHSIPSPAASLEPLSTPSRARSQGTPQTAFSRLASISKKPEGQRRDERVASQQILEPPVAGAAEVCKGGFSTPHGKATCSTSGPITADDTTGLGMPTPSFGLGTGTFGKGVLSGGFKCDDTAHSAAGSSYTSLDTGRETGYGHTSNSLGGRSSIGSSFRWQPSPSGLTTRQVTTSVSSGGGQDRGRAAHEGPIVQAQESLAGERKCAGGVGVAQERTLEDVSNRSAGHFESDSGVQGALKWGQEGVVKSALSKDWLPVLRTDMADFNFETGSSGGNVSPTETVILSAKDLPPLGEGLEYTTEAKHGESEGTGGKPSSGVGKQIEGTSGRQQQPAEKSNIVSETPEVATSATAAADGTLSGGRPSTPSNRQNSTPNPAFVRSIQPAGVALERPQWMREPNRKLAPTLSPVEERSRERGSSNGTSAKSGSKSSGSSSVKSAVTSRGDEETVSLSKPMGMAANPVPGKEKTLPSASAAVSKAEPTEMTGRQGKQLRRLGLSGRARRVAGPDDAPSSAESTEELTTLEAPPKDPISRVKLQARELPSDEELLRKLEGGPAPAVSQEHEERVRQGESSKPSVGAAHVAPADETMQREGGGRIGDSVGHGKGQPEVNGEAGGEVRSAPSSPPGRLVGLPKGPKSVSLEASQPAKSLVTASETVAQSAVPQAPKLAPAQVAQAPVSIRQPSPRPRQPPPVPESDQQLSQAPPQRGPGQAAPTQGSHRTGVSPAPARSSKHQKDSAEVIWVNGKRYQKLRCVGKGGSSKVYKVIGPQRGEFALKQVVLTANITEMRQGFIAEIDLLKRLQKRRNIIRYIDSEVGKNVMCVLLEYGEIDLAGLLKKEEERATEKGYTAGDGSTRVDENFIRSKWQQMLEAVHSVHQERIVHKDLKPANFLSVLGELKLIDFGISKRMVDNSTHIQQQGQNVGTPGYMSPESLQDPGLNVRLSRPSDVWSLGCILYQMAFGNTPYAAMSPEHRKSWMWGIPKISYPPLRNHHLLDAIKQCLKTNPEDRITIPDLLSHPFLRPDLLPVPSPALPLTIGGVALNGQQIQSLLAMANNLDAQMLRQLAATSGPGLAAALQRPAAPTALPPAPPPPRAPPPPPPPPPAAKKPWAPLRAPLQPVKRPALVDNRQLGAGLQGSLAAQVAEIAAARSKRMQSADENGSKNVTRGSAGGVADGLAKVQTESRGRRLVGGSVGSGKENKENVDGHQMLLQQKLASRRKMMEEDMTGDSTADTSFA